uniref:Uncharacterized protein n=1 Tax=Cucumis melo TaxID=3656 RepID=A0A9I9EK36_CUCME
MWGCKISSKCLLFQFLEQGIPLKQIFQLSLPISWFENFKKLRSPASQLGLCSMVSRGLKDEQKSNE